MYDTFFGVVVNSIIKMESGRAGCYLNRDNNIHKRNCSCSSKNESNSMKAKKTYIPSIRYIGIY